MKVELNKIFPLECNADDAWAQLKDIKQVAGCIPGAEISDGTSDTNYTGKVKLKIGPVSLAFNGDVDVKEVDAEKKQLQLVATGKDSKGSSTATMDLTAYIRDGETTETEMIGDAVVSLNGKLVSFGGRMITQVADQILDQFADNFRELLPQSSSEGSTDTPTDSAVAEKPAPSKPKSNEINALGLMWSIFVGWIKKLFGGGK